jgi:hypothetical protein
LRLVRSRIARNVRGTGTGRRRVVAPKRFVADDGVRRFVAVGTRVLEANLHAPALVVADILDRRDNGLACTRAELGQEYVGAICARGEEGAAPQIDAALKTAGEEDVPGRIGRNTARVLIVARRRRRARLVNARRLVSP